MSAAAMTWAISPPITPAPTTPALKTNMARTLVRVAGGTAPVLAFEAELDLRLALVGEAGHSAPQRVGHRPAHEQQVDDRRDRRAVPDPVLERERDRHRVRAGL